MLSLHRATRRLQVTGSMDGVDAVVADFAGMQTAEDARGAWQWAWQVWMADAPRPGVAERQVQAADFS